ncbi:MAG: HupE/UreJ family protein [Nisaea sp.]|uniref:HupE/UreJ family protein n=1 Tax=Nisaea sp. TaxID=2024842 RepID=UPI00329940B2
MNRFCALILCGLAAVASTIALAHEVRPAYLEIHETGPEQYSVLWKRPARGNAVAKIYVKLPQVCQDDSPRASYGVAGATVQRWSASCAGGLAGQKIQIVGLEKTLIETIMRFERRNGATQTLRLMSGQNSFVAAKPSSFSEVAGVYILLGFEHILLGFDHLCFVLALLLLIADVRRLIWSITAFTVAHSLTLTAATLGYVTTPSGPVEALIAFSIVLVAAEVVSIGRGEVSITARYPWTVAFGFGLLHGLGFAGALSKTGLPNDAIPTALLFFNVGVELGQLAFVAGTLVLFAAVRRIDTRVKMAIAYAIGVIAAYWSIERTVGVIM